MTTLHDEPQSGLDLAAMLSGLLGNTNVSALRSLLVSQQENSLVMRRHLLLAQSHMLQASMAIVDNELKRVDAQIEEANAKAPVGREKLVIE